MGSPGPCLSRVQSRRVTRRSAASRRSDAHTAGTQPTPAAVDRGSQDLRAGRGDGVPVHSSVPQPLPPYHLCWCSRPACPQPSWRWWEAAWGRLLGPCEAQPALRCPRSPHCCPLWRSSPRLRPLWRRPRAPWTAGTAPERGRMSRYPSFPSLGAQAVCVVS